MKKKSKDQRWRWICVGSLLLASLNGNLEASGLSHPNVNPVEVSQATRKLRGTILDTNGTPVIGASISVKGTTTGTISDMNGVFTLDVKNGDVLEISFIGYLSHTVKVGTQTDLQIVLKEDTQALDEVVVVGYGVQKKSVMTAAISRVTSDDLEKLTPTRVEDVLRGKVSGVSIMQNSGQPGAESRVRIRGTGTINDSNPLYIVDGMPLEGGVDYLNPQDIQSIEVLKDAASALIFKSPTCTSDDVAACMQLAKKAELDIETYGREMFRAGSNLSGKSAKEIFYQDYKKFSVNNVAIGVGQINSMSAEELEKVKPRLAEFIQGVVQDNSAGIVYFLLTDIVSESSEVLCAGNNANAVIYQAFGVEVKDACVKLQGVVSRKKQFFPAIVEALQQ